MAENIYRFEFLDNTQQTQKINSGVQDTLGSGAKEKPTKKPSGDKATASQEFTKKISEDSLQNFIISPLNTATGGLASPIASTIKTIKNSGMSGAVIGTLGGTLSMMAIQKGIQALQNRMIELENKVTNLNNTDNALIRAGSVSKATYYNANIFGIKQRTDRS